MLAGKRVVVTRAAEQSGALVAALEAHGAIAVVLPLIAFAPPDDVEKLDEAVRKFGEFDWIFLTSQNALRALEESCLRSRLLLREALGNTAVAAVGPATAEAAGEAGVRVDYVASKHDGVSLAQELASEVKGKRVILPRGDRANPELVHALRELGAQVTEVVAYKTVRAENAAETVSKTLMNERPDAILFFSPSAVRHLQELIGEEKFHTLSEQSVFTAIGPVTGRALRSFGVARIVQAEDTTVEGTLRGLAEYFGQVRSVLPAGAKHG